MLLCGYVTSVNQALAEAMRPMVISRKKGNITMQNKDYGWVLNSLEISVSFLCRN